MHLTKTILTLLLSYFYVLISISQTISIDTTFTTDGVIYPFSQGDTSYGIKMSGDIVLNSDTSLVRVIFTDSDSTEYMVYEAYPLISTKSSFSVNDIYDETFCLDELTPYSIRVEIINASLTIDEIVVSNEQCTNAESDRYAAKRSLDSKKTDTLNLRIADFGMDWIASDNSEVAMYYEQKVVLHGEKYNLRGYDYYGGGVYEVAGIMNYSAENSAYVKYYDWRSRHDASDTSSMYWDNQFDNSGWLTPKSSQGNCNSCWVFGPIAVFEGLVNLYYNKHLDFNLSEQYLFSCSAYATCESGGEPDSAFSTAIDHGVKTEDCFPYGGENADIFNCNDTCDYSDTLVFADTLIGIMKSNLDSLKKALINYGPLSVVVDVEGSAMDHAMALVGYKTDYQDSVAIWIFKDSRSSHFYEEKHRDGLIKEVRAVLVPLEIFDTNSSHHYDVNCFDKDGDGYYWWGIGAKPDTCPDCPDQPDCNDNDALIGPCDSFFNELCNYQYESGSIHIDNDTVWASDQIIENTIIVDSGYSLTIRSEIKFVKQSGIIVRPGGELNLYGATLTRVCYDLWDGIEVWGDYDTTQYFSGLQGEVKIDSNTIIEYAETAIIAGSKNIDPSEPNPYLRSGGIVRARNAHFLNNTIDIEFQPYRNLHPYDKKIEFPNSSKFENCLFETDNNDEFEYFPPDKHIVLSQVKDVDFYGCNFKGSEHGDAYFNLDRDKGYGIYSTGSSFRVDDYCTGSGNPCPDSSTIRSQFQNLRYGVYALEWNSSRLITIEGANFENNICGIYLSGTTNSSIVLNNIEVIPKGDLNVIKDTICGIYLDDCTGYQIEEDSIFSSYGLIAADKNYIGLYIKNSGTANNEVFNNDFTGNFYATIIEGINRGDSTGLCIKCNDYTQNKNDIFVVPDTSIRNLNLDQGIAEYQGSPTDSTTTGPAGNTFTVFPQGPDTTDFRFFNFLNDTTEYFNYLHHNYSIQGPRIYPQNVNDSTELILFHHMDEEYLKSESCPSSFTNTSTEELRGMLLTETNLVNSINSDISSQVDGGSTAILLNDIQNSNYSQGTALRQQLLNSSPYLSDTVISASIENEAALPSPFIRDVLTANPHSPKQEEHIDQLDQRSNPLPEYMKQEIINKKYSLDAMDLLISNKRAWENKRDKTLNSLARAYLDTLNSENPADSIIPIIENELFIGRKIELAFLFLNQNDTIEARNILNDIPTNIDLRPLEDSIIVCYTDLFNVLISRKANNFPENHIDSLAANQLFLIYNKNLPGISTRARNLLAATNYLSYKERFYLPDVISLKRGIIFSMPVEDFVLDSHIKIKPNPAKNYIIVSYDLQGDIKNGILDIVDISGNIIQSKSLVKRNDELYINTSHMAPGLYILRIKTQHENLREKFIIIK